MIDPELRRFKAMLSVFQDSFYLLGRDPGKPLDEFLNCSATFDVLEESFHGYTGTLEKPGAAYLSGDPLHCGTL